MNLQQVLPPKSTANGFGHRRGEREGGTRLESKLQSGKSNSARVTSTGSVIGSKSGSFVVPSHDKLLFMTTCLIGLPVEVQVKSGLIYAGIFHAISYEKEFGMLIDFLSVKSTCSYLSYWGLVFGVILKMACLIKDVNFRGQKTAEFISKPPSGNLIIPASELVQVIAKEVAVTSDELANELQHDKQQELMIDSLISRTHHVEEKELEPWIPDADAPQLPELENIFDNPWNRNWDQFEINETLFGVKTSFDEELYTTKLLRGPQTEELEKDATRIAREIAGDETQDLHLAEERGIDLHESLGIDEETRFSSVYRGTGFDDSGYEEDEDIVLNSHNIETFGGSSGSINKRSIGFTIAKGNDGAQLSSSSSVVDEAQITLSGMGADLYRSVPYGGRQMVSEIHNRSFSTVDSESRVQENLFRDCGGNNDAKDFVEKQLLPEDAQLPKSGDSQSSPNTEMDGTDKVGQCANATSYSTSHVSSKGNEKTGSHGEPLEAAVSSKAPGESQSVNSLGSSGISASSNSDHAASALASSVPGLSPSSSVGSLSSEKSTLNAYAKEFKPNPNAKSFIPSQASTRPLSPVGDNAFYHPPDVSALPRLHGMAVGYGMGPSLAGHQPVMYNPQVAPMQSSQTYYHPHGPQYGQQMLVGHSRPVFYMPNYQREMTYKGQDY